MLPCCHVAMLPCCHVAMLPYYHVAMLPYYHVAMLPCYHITILPCCHVAALTVCAGEREPVRLFYSTVGLDRLFKVVQSSIRPSLAVREKKSKLSSSGLVAGSADGFWWGGGEGGMLRGAVLLCMYSNGASFLCADNCPPVITKYGEDLPHTPFTFSLEGH
jgi:hypothetical protein